MTNAVTIFGCGYAGTVMKSALAVTATIPSMRARGILTSLGLSAAVALVQPAAGQEPGATVPDWHMEHLVYMGRESGRWVADNAEYRSEGEPATEYVLEFAPSFDGTSMTGRLYG